MKRSNVNTGRVRIETKNGYLTDITYFTCMSGFCDVCWTLLGALSKFINFRETIG